MNPILIILLLDIVIIALVLTTIIVVVIVVVIVVAIVGASLQLSLTIVVRAIPIITILCITTDNRSNIIGNIINSTIINNCIVV